MNTPKTTTIKYAVNHTNGLIYQIDTKRLTSSILFPHNGRWDAAQQESAFTFRIYFVENYMMRPINKLIVQSFLGIGYNTRYFVRDVPATKRFNPATDIDY